MLKAAVFLDRDGTINRSDGHDGVPIPPDGVEQLELLPGVSEALDRLRRAGFALVVVTNQPDVARGTRELGAVEAIHAELRRRLPLDAILCCYHDDPDDCACRKPRPGMLVDAADHLGLSLGISYLIGDRWRDTEAGRRAGCTTVLLRGPYSGGDQARADFEATDLREATDIILRCQEERAREDLRR